MTNERKQPTYKRHIRTVLPNPAAKSSEDPQTIAITNEMDTPLVLNGRVIVAPGEVPYDTDILRSNLYFMTAVAALTATLLGNNGSYSTMVRGFPCVPIAPPGLSVLVGSNVTPDIMYKLNFLDTTNYGSLPANTTPADQLLKQAFNYGQVTLNTPAPVTVGNTVIHLVQVAFQTADVNNVPREYVNSEDPINNPPIVISGPDTRTDTALVQIKLGVEGVSPTPPTPDPGFIGLYYITVAYGQTSIISGNIQKVSTVEGSPFITEGLIQKTGSAVLNNYVTIDDLQLGNHLYSADSGTVNNIVLNTTPPLTAYQGMTGHSVIWCAPAFTNTSTTVNLNISGLGNLRVKIDSPSGYIDPPIGAIQALNFYQFICDSTNVPTPIAILTNPSTVNLKSWDGAYTPVAVTGSESISITSGEIKQLSQYARVSFTPTGTQVIPITTSLQNINFDQVVTDSLGWWDATNFRFIPTISGRYKITACVNSVGTNNRQYLTLSSDYNSNIFTKGDISSSGVEPNQLDIPGIEVIANGTTNYFDLKWSNPAVLPTTLGNVDPLFTGTQTNYFEIQYLGDN